MYVVIVKPTFDFFFSFILIIVLLPFFIIIYLILIINYTSLNVFFIQERVGKNNNIFNLYKFKTMIDEIYDKKGNKLKDSDRLTFIGKLIRKYSLDELPQLINVFKGEMSLVGPRPLLVEYLNKYSDFEIRRHELRPGITGMAQINGRNKLSFKDRFKFDVWYVENINFILDIKILFRTLIIVILSRDILLDDTNTFN